MHNRIHISPNAKPYLGQECRIVKNYLDANGNQSYALKLVFGGLMAVSCDKLRLIDLAEDFYLKVIEIAD